MVVQINHYVMKIIFICLFFSILFLGCSTQKQIVMWGDCTPFSYPPPVYKGQVTIAFCHITNRDSLKLVVTNIDSLIKEIIYPEIAETDGVQGGITLGFKLDSTRVAKNIKIFNRLGSGIVESILTVLKSFKFAFENETEINDLDGIVTFSFKLYPQKEKAKLN